MLPRDLQSIINIIFPLAETTAAPSRVDLTHVVISGPLVSLKRKERKAASHALITEKFIMSEVSPDLPSTPNGIKSHP